MTAMSWCPLYAECADEPKLRLVARRSGQLLLVVKGWWLHVLCRATASPEPGRLVKWDHEIEAAACGADPEIIEAIWNAAQGLLLAGEVLTGWEKRRLLGAQRTASPRLSMRPAAVKKRKYRRKARGEAAEPELNLAPPAGPESPDICPDMSPEMSGDMSPEMWGHFSPNRGESLVSDQALAGGDPAKGSERESEVEEEGSEATKRIESNNLNPKERRVAPPARLPGLSANIKEQLRQKVMRYCNARLSGEQRSRALLGLAGGDREHDAQWWLDELDGRRRRERWDDTRDAKPSGLRRAA